MPLVRAAAERRGDDPTLPKLRGWMLRLAAAMGSIPSQYMQYYYYTDEVLAELRAKPTTRAQDIMAAVPDYWAHYREQAELEAPTLDPGRSRGGIHELELAIDVMDAIFNDRKEVWPVNVRNGGAIPDLPDDLVVECVGFVDATGVAPVAHGPMPRSVAGLTQALAEYQMLAADAAWNGTRREGVQALVSNPLCRSLAVAEKLYDALAAAHREHLPERLLRN
jgi:6-phospho-beta-glucosidase